MWSFIPLLATLLGGVGCDPNPAEDLVRFNADGDAVVVRIAPDPDDPSPVSTPLRSTTGAVLVGEGSVSPGGGPVGTVHVIAVDVDDAFELQVTHVSVITDAGDRGAEEHTLVRDSADRGHWRLSLTSWGVEGELRDDTLTFLLWAPDADRAAE